MTTPGNYRAQSIINQDLDRCDYFVGLLWDNWGSNPDDGNSKYTSGFEEDFERAQSRFDSGLMYDVVLFFKDIPDAQSKDAGSSASKVLDFKNKCIQRRKPLFKTFRALVEFERLFRLSMEKIGWTESNRLETHSSRSSNPDEPDGSKRKAWGARSGRIRKFS